MDILFTIKYLLGIAILLYFSAAFAAWIYELRISSLYRRMKAQINFLENLRVSSAVFRIKTYKITHDYHRNITEMERMQKFLFEKVLFIARKNEKIKGSFLF
jgi:hypothetical protein